MLVFAGFLHGFHVFSPLCFAVIFPCLVCRLDSPLQLEMFGRVCERPLFKYRESIQGERTLVCSKGPRSDTNGGGEFEVTAASAPCRSNNIKREIDRQVRLHLSNRDVDMEADRGVEARGRDLRGCPTSLTVTRAERRWGWPTTWVHKVAACCTRCVWLRVPGGNSDADILIEIGRRNEW